MTPKQKAKLLHRVKEHIGKGVVWGDADYLLFDLFYLFNEQEEELKTLKQIMNDYAQETSIVVNARKAMLKEVVDYIGEYSDGLNQMEQEITGQNRATRQFARGQLQRVMSGLQIKYKGSFEEPKEP